MAAVLGQQVNTQNPTSMTSSHFVTMAYQPSEDEIALTMQTYSLSRSSAIDELEKARSCPGCKQDWGMSKREQKKHMETCPSKAKKTVSKRVKKNPKQLVQSINALATQDQASIVPTTPDQVTTEDFILDIEVTAEEQENKVSFHVDPSNIEITWTGSIFTRLLKAREHVQCSQVTPSNCSCKLG